MTTDSGIPAGQDSAAGPLRVGSPLEVLAVFARLGVSSFGGPIAHLGYFRDELVTRRRWIDDSAYADLVALCQFLPGPASSQVGFALGLLRGGWLGGIAAWVGFTLPSAIAMVLFAFGAGRLGGPIGAGVMHGLKLVAVAIVAQAVWGMARSLCPDRPRAAICLVAIAVIAVAGGSLGQIAAIVLGGALGLVLCRNAADATFGHLPAPPVSRAAGAILLALFMGLLIVPPLVVATWQSQALAMFDAFYRSGALVFGGGHVVLPLLRAAVVPPGWVADDAFLAGYGAAQALPGPLFTFGAYLGAVMRPPPNGVLGAALALVAIALPGLLLVAGALPFWDAFRRRRGAQASMRGTNAAVVGILATALYDPVWTTAVLSLRDFTLAAFGFVLLLVWRAPPLAVVVAIALASAALAALSR
jgi:chromate transporter